jgi:hypothetical protein
LGAAEWALDRLLNRFNIKAQETRKEDKAGFLTLVVHEFRHGAIGKKLAACKLKK